MQLDKFVCLSCWTGDKEFYEKFPVYDGVLVIPKELNGKVVKSLTKVRRNHNCPCLNYRMEVKKVIFDTDRVMAYKALNYFPNLEVIELNGHVSFEVDDLKECKNLKKIILKNRESCTSINNILTARSSVEVLDIRCQMPHYVKNQFRDYSKLQPSWVLREGVKSIEDYAFYNCLSFEHVSLPKSLRFLSHLAFENCMNIKEFKINSYVVFKIPTRYEFSIESYRMLLRNSKDAVVYCPVDYPIHYLKRYLYPGIKVVESGKVYADTKVGTDYNKFNVFGIRTIFRDIPQTLDELIELLESMDDKIWQKIFISEALDVFEDGFRTPRRIIGDGVFFAMVELDSVIRLKIEGYGNAHRDSKYVDDLFNHNIKIELKDGMAIFHFSDEDGQIVKVSILIDKDEIIKLLKKRQSSSMFMSREVSVESLGDKELKVVVLRIKPNLEK